MDIDALRSAVAADGLTIEWTDRTGSTNADLLAAAADPSVAEWTVLLTDFQDAGRGRLGRAWTAPAGTQLIFSLLIRLRPAELDRLGTLPLAAGLAFADTLDGTRLKWPNDVLVGEKKLCGILAEAAGFPDSPRIVIGCGLNVSLTREQLPVPHATSLVLEGMRADDSGHVDREELAADVLRAMSSRLNQWRAADPALLDDYRAACASIGLDVRLDTARGEVFGRVDGVDKEGRIVLGDGSAHSAGDVTHLRPIDPDHPWNRR